MDETNLLLLKKKLKAIKKFRGTGTQLISVYLPPDADRSSVTKQLTDEQSQSSNIKSSQTRKNVQAALKRIINYLRQIDFRLPENGLVLFSGDVSTNPSKSDVTLLEVIPPKRLTTKLYWCDSAFHTAPLEEMAETDEVYGFIAVDKREATLALLRGKAIQILSSETSAVPGKSRAGGQSSHRFERLREKAEEDFYKRVGEKVNAAFVGIEKLKGIVVGGPGHSKNWFLEAGDLDHRIKNKVIGTIDTSYTDESGIKEILDKSGDILKEVGVMKERALVNKFVERVAKNELATYGYREVMTALDLGQVDTVLLSEGITWMANKYKCNSCNHIDYKIIRDPEKEEKKETIQCSSCGKDAELIEELDIFDYFVEIAENTSTKVELISIESPEGKQFFETFGGLGAFLRYKI